jgi:hypothetical protein
VLEQAPAAAVLLGTSLELVFRTYAHSIEAMRGRPSTSIAEAISAARAGAGFDRPVGYEALARPRRSKLG